MVNSHIHDIVQSYRQCTCTVIATVYMYVTQYSVSPRQLTTAHPWYYTFHHNIIYRSWILANPYKNTSLCNSNIKSEAWSAWLFMYCKWAKTNPANITTEEEQPYEHNQCWQRSSYGALFPSLNTVSNIQWPCQCVDTGHTWLYLHDIV